MIWSNIFFIQLYALPSHSLTVLIALVNGLASLRPFLISEIFTPSLAVIVRTLSRIRGTAAFRIGLIPSDQIAFTPSTIIPIPSASPTTVVCNLSEIDIESTASYRKS